MSNILTPQNVLVIAPGAGASAAVIAGVLNQYGTQYGIDTPKRMAYLMGQLAVESGDFTAYRENLIYSTPERIQAVWPSRFPTVESAKPYVKAPQKLANKVYGDRMGNRGVDTNDGWDFRGVGWIQLTGRDNITQFANAIGLTPEVAASYASGTNGAAHAACWFWSKNNINRLADFGNIDSVSDAVNLGRLTAKVGDAEGFAKRVAKTNLALKALGA